MRSLLLGIAATCCLLAASHAKTIERSRQDKKQTDLHESRRKVSKQPSVDYYYETDATTESSGPHEVYKFETTRKPSYRQSEKDRKRRNKKNRKHKKESNKEELEDESQLALDENQLGPSKKELLDMAKQHAMRVIVEKIFMAFGPKFIEETRKAPKKNFTLLDFPTVASPLNITTGPCPASYTGCSTVIYYSSCDPAPGSDEGLWNQRFNFFFDLPGDMWRNEDELLNGTVRIYKYKALPLQNPVDIMVHIHAYTASFTRKKDWNILINTVKVSSDYVGWVTLDVSDWVHKNAPEKNFGFFIKISDEQGFLWNKPSEFFEQRNCSEVDKNTRILAIPFEVETTEPKEKFPSLTIRTGILNYYQKMYQGIEQTDYNDTFDYESFPDYNDEEIVDEPQEDKLEEEEEEYVMKSKPHHFVDQKEEDIDYIEEPKMARDDPQVHYKHRIKNYDTIPRLRSEEIEDIEEPQEEELDEEMVEEHHHHRSVSREKTKSRPHHPPTFNYRQTVIVQNPPTANPLEAFSQTGRPALSSLEDERDFSARQPSTRNRPYSDKFLADRVVTKPRSGTQRPVTHSPKKRQRQRKRNAQSNKHRHSGKYSKKRHHNKSN